MDNIPLNKPQKMLRVNLAIIPFILLVNVIYRTERNQRTGGLILASNHFTIALSDGHNATLVALRSMSLLWLVFIWRMAIIYLEASD